MSEALRRLLDSPDFIEGDAWRTCEFQQHKEIISEGDEAVDLYLLLTGTVRVVGTAKLDEARTVRPGYSDLEVGAVFGEMSLFDDGERSGSVIAVTDCTLAAINVHALSVYMDEHPDVGYPILKQFIENMVARLRKANQRVTSLFAWGLKAHGIDEEM